MTRHVLAALLILFASAAARAMAGEFPAGSSQLSEDSLRAGIADKTFSVRPATGREWRWEFRKDGDYFIHVGQFNDRGTWTVKDSTLCSAGQRVHNLASPPCNEVRAKDGELYLKRDNGEIVKLVPQ